MSTDVEWRAVPGYEGHYEVSDQGGIRSLKRGKATLMKPHRNRMGYMQVSLCLNGQITNWKMHRLVLLSFAGPRPEDQVICHWDGNPSNNALANLRYDSTSANQHDSGTAFVARFLLLMRGATAAWPVTLWSVPVRLWRRTGMASEIRETRPCGACGHKHYASQDCPDHDWTDFCPYEGLDCPKNLAELLVLQAAESAVRYGPDPSLDDLLPPAVD